MRNETGWSLSHAGNFSESIDMADERQQFQGNRPQGRRQVMEMGMVERSRRGRIGRPRHPSRVRACPIRNHNAVTSVTVSWDSRNHYENGDSDATRARNLVKRFHDLARRIPLHSPVPRKFLSKAPTWRIEQRAESLSILVLLDSGLH